MNPRIIIPAAGDAVRFGGLPKELLPISEADCSLTHAVRLGQTFGDVLIVSNPDKEHWHRVALKRAELDCEIAVRKDHRKKDLWGSIEFGLAAGGETRAGGLILADTVTVPAKDCETPKVKPDLAFGCFKTWEPERFSVLLPDRIATKAPRGVMERPALAWGMVMWSAAAADFLLGLEVSHYDRAFEAAMQRFHWHMFDLTSYHDLGTFQAYKNFLATNGTNKTQI